MSSYSIGSVGMFHQFDLFATFISGTSLVPSSAGVVRSDLYTFGWCATQHAPIHRPVYTVVVIPLTLLGGKPSPTCHLKQTHHQAAPATASDRQVAPTPYYSPGGFRIRG